MYDSDDPYRCMFSPFLLFLGSLGVNLTAFCDAMEGSSGKKLKGISLKERDLPAVATFGMSSVCGI